MDCKGPVVLEEAAFSRRVGPGVGAGTGTLDGIGVGTLEGRRVFATVATVITLLALATTSVTAVTKSSEDRSVAIAAAKSCGEDAFVSDDKSALMSKLISQV